MTYLSSFMEQGSGCDIELSNDVIHSGMTLTILLAVVIACRVRVMRRRGRKRNLASDSDGDYLVNGMYL